MIIYVDQKAGGAGDGTREHPYLTISEAAAKACPGDEVLVAPGIYREAVDPANAGTEDARITYRSEVPLGAVITGAEVVSGWEHVEGDVWTARVKNTLFGDCNPYTTLVSGDWFIAWFTAHIGEVYLDGKALYELVGAKAALAGMGAWNRPNAEGCKNLARWLLDAISTNDLLDRPASAAENL